MQIKEDLCLGGLNSNLKIMKIELVVKNQGSVISFKNNKMIAKGRLITDPKKQKWMRRCIQSFASQLSCITQTTYAGMLTERPAPSSTVLFPLDDSWQWIPQLIVIAERCAKGDEGATITIEEI